MLSVNSDDSDFSDILLSDSEYKQNIEKNYFEALKNTKNEKKN